MGPVRLERLTFSTEYCGGDGLLKEMFDHVRTGSSVCYHSERGKSLIPWIQGLVFGEAS